MNHRRLTRSTVWLAAGVLAVAGRTSGAADQDSTPATSIAPPDAAGKLTPEPAGGLAEIVVTAERREESAQEAPLTIQVLGAEQARDSGMSSVADLGKLTTGVEIGVGGSSTQIFIRGVGDFSFNPLSNPGVAFNVDGVYVGRPDGLGGNLYDVARVEVLEGPQGTLYGRNANGGSINVITNDPKLDQTGGDLNVEIGNYQLIHTDGALNLPVGDKAALRVAFNVVHRNGYLSDGTSDDVQQSGRLKFKRVPSDDVSLIFSADYSHLGGDNGGYTYLPRRPGADAWEGVASPAAVAYRDSIVPFGPLLDPTLPAPRLDTTLWSVSSQLDWNLGFATLTLLPAYRDSDIHSLSYPGFLFNQPNRDHQRSFEARLGNSSELLTWVFGGYYFHNDSIGSINVLESDILQNTLLNYRPRTDAYAAFGQATVQLVSRLRLIAGARETYEKRSLDGDYVDERPAPFGPGTGTVLERFPGQTHFNGVTYKAGFEYDLAAANLLYLTASTGFKAGGLNETVAPDAVYQPEKLRAFEFGSRNRFFDNHLQVNFGLYDWKYQDLQDQRVTFDPLGVINFLFSNVGDATIKGATLDIVAKPWAADTFSTSIEYADSYYDSFTVKIPTAVFFPGSIGCPTQDVGTSTVANCSGFEVARVPRFTGTTTYEHVFQVPNGATVSLAASAKFATRRWIATDFIAAERAAAYATFDLNMDYRAADERFSVGAFVRNLGNKAYYTGGFEQPFVAGLFAANVSAPRTYGVRGSVNFGAR